MSSIFNDDIKVTPVYNKFYGIDIESSYLLPSVNLNNDDRKALGLKIFNEDKEVDYVETKTDDRTGEQYQNIIIELYARTVNSTQEELNDKVHPIRFYVTDQFRNIASTGKYQYINEYGQTTWQEADTVEELVETNYFKLSHVDDMRRTYNGEDKLLDAISEMFGIRSGQFILDMNKIINGNVSEIVKLIKEGTVKLKDKNSYKPFSILHVIKTSTKEDEDGNIKTYYNQTVLPLGFKPKSIRKSIDYKEGNGSMGRYIYKADGVLLNYLTKFDDTKPSSGTTDDSDDDIDDLPF